MENLIFLFVFLHYFVLKPSRTAILFSRWDTKKYRGPCWNNQSNWKLPKGLKSRLMIAAAKGFIALKVEYVVVI